MSQVNQPYQVYTAGGMFSIHELAMNVVIKEAVWRLSEGKFELILPQSKTSQEMTGSDLSADIRNFDLQAIMRADMVLAQFDGLELDAGTVVEFMMAKLLGKPAVILRCDSHRMSGKALDDPYNLMVKHWPRTVEVWAESLEIYVEKLTQAQKTLLVPIQPESVLESELQAVQEGINQISRQLLAGLENALCLPSPYPVEYQEEVYRIARFMPGKTFTASLSEDELSEILKTLKDNSTL